MKIITAHVDMDFPTYNQCIDSQTMNIVNTIRKYLWKGNYGIDNNGDIQIEIDTSFELDLKVLDDALKHTDFKPVNHLHPYDNQPHLCVIYLTKRN